MTLPSVEKLLPCDTDEEFCFNQTHYSSCQAILRPKIREALKAAMEAVAERARLYKGSGMYRSTYVVEQIEAEIRMLQEELE